ncbi:MAG: heterodisulfide reductase-related iron-sulfur binding cluster [Dehalococcoidia bacterium]
MTGPGFDRHHPPDAALIADCVHCGFCLPTCPTYLLWGLEPDSPRGRIDLMDGVLQRQIGLTPATVDHFDNCLGCLACVSACPSGVQYGRLIEQTRAQLERNAPRTAGDRLFRWLIFQLFPYPDRLRALLPALRLYRQSGIRAAVQRAGLLARLPERLQAMESLTPPLPPALVRPLPTRTPPQRMLRLRVGLLTGCVQQVFFQHVNEATIRVLAAEGCEVIVPPQGCCGALELHAGREPGALRRARALISALEGADRIVVNAAGCGSSMKEYGTLLADDRRWAGRAARFSAKVRDVSEILAELEPIATYQPLPLSVAYQDACHLQHAQGVRLQPRAVLGRVPGLRLAEVREPEICCGSAGVYNLLVPQPARELGDRKAAAVLATGADALASANPGCLIQIQSALSRVGRSLPVFHPIELIDASIRGERVDALLAGRPGKAG